MGFSTETISGIMLFITLSLHLIGVAVAVLLDVNLEKKRRSIMIALICLSFALVLQDYGETVFSVYRTDVFWRTFFAVLGYALRPTILVLFVCLIDPKRKHVVAWVLVGLNALLHTTAFYTNWVFMISKLNYYEGGPLKYTCHIVSSILLAYNVFVAIREFKEEKAKGILMPLVFAALVVVGIVLDIVKDPWTFRWTGYVTVAVVECCVLFYLWLHFVLQRRYQKAIETEQRYKTMISQLQPHFIYNTLSAITVIDGMPEKAKKAIYDFSTYLRQNLDAMTSAELVPFEKELEHINKYLDLEKLRFGEKINVVFDIKCFDFSLPPLTVQLLVENAVKHGITQKDEGGTIYVSTEKDDRNYIVTVRDDGVGFDTEKEISGNHIGINNIRKRIEYSIDGTLEIASEIGKGTTATIIIPEKKEKKNETDHR